MRQAEQIQAAYLLMCDYWRIMGYRYAPPWHLPLRIQNVRVRFRREP